MHGESDAQAQIEQEIIDKLGDEEEVIPYKYSITSYGADYPVDSLVKRMSDGSIIIPSFQRGFVWSSIRASRFVESLLLGLPVPGIFLSKEYGTQKLLVIDGQQRLLTLKYFYGGIFANTGREFSLRGVQSHFLGCTYKALLDEDRRRLDDSILHATIVKQDEPSEDNSSIYHIFERLNTGGMQLAAQEIRACIYHGGFNDLLRDLNNVTPWRQIYGRVNRRMRDQELILRFFALFFNGDAYKRPMREFLNTYMGKNRHFGLQSSDELSRLFTETIRVIHAHIGDKAFRPARALNAAVFDSVMVGVARRLEQSPISDTGAMREAYENLLEDERFIAATHTSTADEMSVNHRLLLSLGAFANIT